MSKLLRPAAILPKLQKLQVRLINHRGTVIFLELVTQFSEIIGALCLLLPSYPPSSLCSV